MSVRTSALPVAVALLLLVTAASLAGCVASPAQATPVDAAASHINAGTGGSGTSAPGVPSTSPKPTDAASRYDAFSLTVSCDQFLEAQASGTGAAALQQTIRLGVDGVVTVTLCSNASTGYSWEEPRYDPSALALVSHNTQPPAGTAPGAPGSDTWVFRALGCPATAPLACGKLRRRVHVQPAVGRRGESRLDVHHDGRHRPGAPDRAGPASAVGAGPALIRDAGPGCRRDGRHSPTGRR